MKNLTVREFRMNLAKYLSELVAGDEISIYGVQLKCISQKRPANPSASVWKFGNIRGIYLIKCNEYYKIGRAKNVRDRFFGLQSSNPHELHVIDAWNVENAEELEMSLHLNFQNKSVRGEWFLFDDEDIKKIYTIMGDGVIPKST